MREISTTSWGRMDFVNFYTKVWGVPVIPINVKLDVYLDGEKVTDAVIERITEQVRLRGGM